MNTVEAISARRSIRRYKDEPIAAETLEIILRAGMLAPSGKNRQLRRFAVVQGAKLAETVRVMRERLA